MIPPTQALIKDVAALKQKKFREESGSILAEGRHPIEEAIRAGLTMKHAFYQPHQPDGLPQEVFPIAPYPVDEKTMARLSSTTSPPPCLAVFEKPVYPDATTLLASQTNPLVLVLDDIQDPGNLGTLIRSAMAFGVHAVILLGHCVEPYNPKVIRASAGLIFALPVVECSYEHWPMLFPNEAQWTLYATTGHKDALPYQAATYKGACAIILGNEGRGVSPQILNPETALDKPQSPAASLQALTIPMSPQVESLNVAVSGSIILAEAASKRAVSIKAQALSPS